MISIVIFGIRYLIMTDPKRDWRKIKYYPVSMKKLERASMRETEVADDVEPFVYDDNNFSYDL
jgi:hypothetical protein